MRKFVIALTIIAFLACFILGLYLAEIVPGKGELKGSAFKAPLSTPASRFQHNILVILVDDLQSITPQLVSIWGLIIYFPEPKLIFQRIFPLEMLANEEIAESFSISASKVPGTTFLRVLNDNLNITWDNYILLDALAGDAISTWAGGQVLSQMDISTNRDQLISMEGESVQLICSKFSAQSQGARDPFDWSQLIPDHFRTDIPLDFGLLSIDRLALPGIPVQCEIYND